MTEKSSNPIYISVLELSPILIPYFLGFFVFRGFFSNFPLYLQLVNNLTDTQTVEIWAIISGIALFIGALTRLPAGLISDSIGRINAIVFAYFVYAGSLVVILLFKHNIIYVIGISTIRFGNNFYAMSGRAVVSRAKRDRGLKNGLLSSMVGLGSFAGPSLLAYVLDNYKPDTIIVISLIILIIDFILFLSALFFVPRLLDKFFSHKIDLDLSRVNNLGWSTLKSGLKREGISQMFFLFFSSGMIYGLITSVYTIYGFNVLFINLTLLGIITGSGALIQVIWAPIVGKLYQSVRDEFMRLLAWVLLLISTILMILSSSGIIFFIIGFFVLNLGNATYFVMEITKLSRIVKQEEFSGVFGLGTSLVILGTAFSGFTSPFFYNLSREGTFFAAFVFAIVSLILILVNWLKKN